ncbi:MAG: hypothetical protein ACRDNK_05860 [Solirubrobacteraceae bacterium]
MILTVSLMLASVTLVASLMNLWPTVDAGPGVGSPATVRLLLGALPVHVNASTALILLAVNAGALGSMIPAATSLADYVGNRQLYASWIVWYVMRPLVGSLLALLLYFALRGGFLSSGAQSSALNPYGVAALASLSGLCSNQATDKLRDLFEAVFRAGSSRADELRRDPLSGEHPAPDGGSVPTH